MALLLHIETATMNGSIAISENERLLAFKELGAGEKHVKTLAPTVKLMLETLEVSITQIDAVAISSGPGSYTGLRIGTAFCKGICLALDIPLIAVPTLQIIGHAIVLKHSCDVAIPMLDARRMEVYYAVFDQQLNELEAAAPHILDGNSFLRYKDQKVVVAGNANAKAKRIFDNSTFLFDDELSLSASYMPSIVFDKYLNRSFENMGSFEPNYIKDFIVGQSHKLESILKGGT